MQSSANIGLSRQEPPDSEKKSDIAALTGLRGVAAFWVFLFHAGNFAGRIGVETSLILSGLGAAGFLGVDIFFVLSGFILSHKYMKSGLHSSLSNYGRFLYKRLARIYPVHLWALCLVGLLQSVLMAVGIRLYSEKHLSLEGLLASLTMTHAWGLPVIRTWNTVSWSISSEWAAYLLFPLIALLASKLRSRGLVAAVLAGLFVCLALVVTQENYKGTMAYGLPRIAVGFSAGVLVYRLWLLQGLGPSRFGSLIAALSLSGLVVGGSALAIEYGDQTALMWLPVLSCFLIYGLAAGSGLMCQGLSTSFADYAGRISYSFYMVHGIVFSVFTAVIKQTEVFKGTESFWGIFLGVLATTWLLADLTYRFCEVPARRWLLRRIRKV